MARTFTIARLIALAGVLLATPACAQTPDKGVSNAEPGACVVLLHGLARSSLAMYPMARALEDAGFATVNQDYPSTEKPIAELARTHVPPAVAECRQKTPGPVHFVTHSLGGILVRYYLHQRDQVPQATRVVMLAPPNQGSEVVDQFQDFGPYEWWMGPAGQELSTDESSVPNRLPVPAAAVDIGIIAGTDTLNPYFSSLLPGPDDGAVSLASTRLPGMDDFLALPVTHTFIMFDSTVMDQTIHFLRHGRFVHDGEAGRATREAEAQTR